MRLIDADALMDYLQTIPIDLGYRGIEDVKRFVNKMPTIEERKTEWIPCGERLPEDGTNCLVSVRCSKNVAIDVARYSTDLFKVDRWDFSDNREESGWYYYDSEYGYCKLMNIIAWMPLPEPYQGEGDSNDHQM